MVLQDVWKKEPVKDLCVETVLDDPTVAGRVHGHCVYPPGKGNISIMMIGNSYVLNLNEHIRAHFNYNYSEYRYTSMAECFGLYADTHTSQEVIDSFKRQVELHKPDVLFITSRYSKPVKSPIQKNDNFVQQMNENIAFYEKFVKKIYILDAMPLFKKNFLNHFMQYVVQKPEDLESLHLNRQEADNEMKYVKKRFSMVKCNKCKFYDLSPVFLENGKYLTFNRTSMLAYADNSVHITGPGIEICEPVFEKNAREIMDNL